MPRTGRFWLAVAFLFSTSPVLAYTQQESGACVGDAFKFCSYAIPNETRVKSCLIENVQRLTSGCQRYFYVPPRARTPGANGRVQG